MSNATDIQVQVDRLIDERPGRELLHPDFDEKAVPLNDFIYRSQGSSASTMLVTSAGRVIVNTGMGFEAPHHKHVFDEVCPGPTPYIITTQGHVDHVGGVAVFRDDTTCYVAQESNPACQADDERLQQFRGGTALRWFPKLPAQIREFSQRYASTMKGQDKPTPDKMFEERTSFTVGGLEIELIAMPGGETIDSLAVWLPQHRVAILSNLFGPLFPHFPNFNTLRGDKYRFAVPYLANVKRMRELKPTMLITGRGMPIEGEELIDACLGRLHDSVDYVHEQTAAGINAGKDIYMIMREVKLPPELRVGQGYGKVEWGVRTFFEQYTGWFQRRSTAELYPSDPADALSELAALADIPSVLERARARMESGDVATAIRLLEAILSVRPDQPEAASLMAFAHEKLLKEGGDVSFWENGWLESERDRWQQIAED
ncbi:MAG TPA: MBL fold metallo-hydrolase [Myxococcales bacterium]|nr:MBL fold metallo-hydrolase [Myxococcales bacterium]